jgi:protein-S-isoprenylcysteine O-methyltransferase Ste14
MSSITTSLFGLGLLSGGILLGGLLVSIQSQSHRFWPHGTRNLTFWLGWTAWVTYVGSLFGVAYLDWWSWYRPSTLFQLASLSLLLVGAVVSLWAVWRLGFRESSGLEGELNTQGPYRYSRNPQYVSYVLMLVSGSVLTGSWKTAVLALLGIVWFLLAPFAEEPWLREQYGAAYEAYRESVPRFIGRPRQRPPQKERPNASRRDNHD